MSINYRKLFDQVEKPGRYIGKELNSVIKNLDDIDVRYVFAFPDLYEIGMSHLGMHILYGVLNSVDKVWCERVFSVATDLEEQLRNNNIPLFSIESRTPLSEFDFIGFTLQYELSYTNILNILELGGIPLYSSERDERHPIVMMGGPCAFNPEPVADFADMILIGEGEEQMIEVMELYKTHKKSNYSKKEFLLEAARTIEGIYIPSFYEVSYKVDNTINAVVPLYEKIPLTIKKRIIKDMDSVFFPEKLMVPNIEVVHGRIILEIFRGCTRGCRFCQAGMIYRPVRERSVEKLLELADSTFKSTGYEEMSLSSLSSSDHSKLGELLDELNEKHSSNMTSISLPSLRLDNFSVEMAEKVQKVKKSGLTFAPEAGTQRLRNVINKGVTNEDLMETSYKAFSNGWNRIKLYFMIGLPTETYEDIEGIAKMAYDTLDVHKQINNGRINSRTSITVSSACFVPKPFTPFQWMQQDDIQTLREKQRYLKEKFKSSKNISFSYHAPLTSGLEGVVARGDRRLSTVIETAFKSGCKFDGWDIHFSFDKWANAFEKCNVDMNFYSTRKREYDEILPWDHIDCGVSKEFLISENEKAINAETSQVCRDGCIGCNVNADIARGLC